MGKSSELHRKSGFVRKKFSADKGPVLLPLKKTPNIRNWDFNF